MSDDFAELWESLEPNGYHVYRLFDREDRLLYVGITSVLKTRIKQHHDEKAWADEIARLEHENGYTRTEALLRESQLIRDLKPVHNEARPLDKDQRITAYAWKHKLPSDTRRELFTYAPRLRALQMPLEQLEAVLHAYGRGDLARRVLDLLAVESNG